MNLFSTSRRSLSRWSSDQHSSRPPVYQSNPTSPPSYASSTTQDSNHERIRAWSESVPVWNIASTVMESVADYQQDLLGAASMTEIPVDIANGPYLFYRVYTKDGIIPSKRPINRSDPYLGRIDANMITPPHTVTSIKRCISSVEMIKNHTRTNLFLSASSVTLMDEHDHVEILTGEGPGSTSGQPLALVVTSHKGAGSTMMSMTGTCVDAAAGPRYLYYRIYIEDGIIPSKQPVDPRNPYLGRIDANIVAPPPHTQLRRSFGVFPKSRTQ